MDPRSGRDYCTKSIELRKVLFNFPENVEMETDDNEPAEVTDHSPQELAKIEALADDEEELEPESKKGKYSGAASKRTRPMVHSVLYIHVGREDRTPIKKGCFGTFMNCANLEIVKMVWID